MRQERMATAAQTCGCSGGSGVRDSDRVSCWRVERAEMGRDAWQGRRTGVARGGGGFLMVHLGN